MQIRDSVAIIVGGASGMARATAELLAEEGARVQANEVMRDLHCARRARVLQRTQKLARQLQAAQQLALLPLGGGGELLCKRAVAALPAHSRAWKRDSRATPDPRPALQHERAPQQVLLNPVSADC